MNFSVNGEQLDAIFNRLLTRLGDTDSVLKQIGADLVASTDERYKKQVAPDGKAWPPLSPRTIAVKRAKGYRSEILRRTDLLRQSIAAEVEGDTVRVGTSVRYARKMQFGGKFRIGKTVVLVPARPFLGLTPSDRLAAIERVRVFVKSAL